jgi:hypothetical protein
MSGMRDSIIEFENSDDERLALTLAPSPGRYANEALEHRCEVRLRLKAYGESDVDERNVGCGEQDLCALDTAAQQILVRPQAGRHPELGGETVTCMSPPA